MHTRRSDVYHIQVWGIVYLRAGFVRTFFRIN